VDPEQVRRGMSVTRASIDRKLDELSMRSTVARQDAIKRGSAAAMIATAGIIGLWWWRHERKPRRRHARAIEVRLR